ncbi:hypothetical protein PHYBLDRAFT_141776 [Phycomyces blakesleeanus NRRL 1555(-)]|uniref:Uncharacterized protein n=1 Tax=Phycomyces blakesleeanus (strain ATCC 8743b / DSM 1359 / FGSC 10004 / NBRC 33097 / NRRL 1555) TaxID=763407 RepID=A0A162UTR5_PHYB8|nr:hypothetical protein PHYBLDRAFT_141776 [Phycomyces blakesleeanus NRRL 1555(-)]OAD77913.1 hypothetical protein PHYBLDRAFT_141776 [Phycomyces blakesleeanus NRRL 1555(-)]|eukprot:XP_018295953.1 hypothetical protein PHYBLDRAFT_141776 [Phycomyces blakesleeanus NRRL 1555(-)]
MPILRRRAFRYPNTSNRSSWLDKSNTLVQSTTGPNSSRRHPSKETREKVEAQIKARIFCHGLPYSAMLLPVHLQDTIANGYKSGQHSQSCSRLVSMARWFSGCVDSFFKGKQTLGSASFLQKPTGPYLSAPHLLSHA